MAIEVIMVSLDLKQLRIGVALCLSIGFIIQFPNPGHSQPTKVDKDLEAVLDDWQARQKIMKSVRYVLKGTTEFRDANLPPGNPIQPRESTLLLDLVNHRFRHYDSQPVIDLLGNRMEEVHKGGYSQMVSTTSYDGKKYYFYRHRQLNGISQDLSDLSITEGKMPVNLAFDSMFKPIFFAHGYVNTIYQPLTKDHWISRLDAEYFRNRGYQPYEGLNLQVFTTDPMANSAEELKNGGRFDEYWINRDRKSLIQRYFYQAKGDAWVHLEISAKETPLGWWVDEWTNTNSSNNRVERIFHLRIVEMEVNPPLNDSDFVLPAEPGMRVDVGKFDSPGTIFPGPAKESPTTKYRISPSGAWIALSSNGEPVGLFSSLKSWLTASISSVVVLFLAFFFLWRKKSFINQSFSFPKPRGNP